MEAIHEAGDLPGPNGPALGVVEGELVVDVGAALDWGGLLKKPEPNLRAAVETLEAAERSPADMIDLIGRGTDYLRVLGVVTGAAASTAPDEDGLLTPVAKARLRAPIGRPPKITCVGLNYADHAREQGIEAPETPVFFLKSSNTIIGPGDPIRIPPNTEQPDYEAELAVVIGKGGSRIPQERAWEYVAGYTLLNDVTARDMQSGDKQWFRGKSCDTFAPTGPWIVTRGRNLRSARARHFPDAQRPDHAGFEHLEPDPPDRFSDQLPFAVAQLGTGRSDLHRHAAGRGHGSQAAGLYQGWRRDQRDDRGHRNP